MLRQQDFPAAWTSISIADPVNDAVDWITRTFGGVTAAISDATVKYALDPLREPADRRCRGGWSAAVAALLAWRAVAAMEPRACSSFCCIAAIGVLGMWDDAMDTLSQVIVAVVIVGRASRSRSASGAARSDRVQRVLRPFLDAMQTMPQFVYLVPVDGPVRRRARARRDRGASIYALPPGIRLTDLGIRQVPKETVEAARRSARRRARYSGRCSCPWRGPSILLGVNQTIMMVLSVVIIAGLIGGGALGSR